MPKFNVLLKDDKTYPYIKVNIKADYPDVYITRRILMMELNILDHMQMQAVQKRWWIS